MPIKVEQKMSQAHLAYESRVNLGSYYTPPEIVNTAWEMIAPYVRSQTTVVDSACGYGDFLKDCGQSITIGCDIDETAIDVAKKNSGNKVRFFQTNALCDVSRAKFGIPQQSDLIVVGNPPYNDRTSLIRHNIKDVNFDIDEDIACRDLGISFLRSYNKLEADIICVLHPLSYLIKLTNFRLLKAFTANYRLIDGLLISSSEFPESAKHTAFPIVLALYQRDTQGMAYNFIRAFRFRVKGKSDFCLGDFDYINNYIDKYPKKKRPTYVEADVQYSENEDSLFFWTMRDINALKRNRTFVESYSANTIVLDKRKLDYYVYVDVFKRNLHRLPFYFGNCDVLIDDNLFRQYKSAFISDTIKHHPFLKKRFQINPIERQQAASGLDMYFKLLLGEHHV
ncbi:SAM-dependent methyltransferase [Candidatus Poribacteria bacterium]|nr:MAG: SAM-dependent methyltransferase [Candidatus Poribacteria bacterium]